ncbi:hypothetical protein CNEO2_90011 [Clostridium neonatale]|uniref:Uncharacterized protein n=1 Tax=Clostridium neonatale TaxID=137838 RepID=A0AAD2DFE2_9CLOT|nr:hypothetical protein CNEO2_1120006 [Clostridium neonatale]CAI3193323.1 hypothetical protein CNEO2_110080 [Clostridium neonatale]CAI3197111.1 hypothetical protein CNEO2_150079 [Clostridium neonatale]CAI3560319.1 hypothetical protein CNEO2_100081 [Clostridium neonatale]CAI3569507.1 hypothetical protein CNEO2_120078 [Clostridium neonatale]
MDLYFIGDYIMVALAIFLCLNIIKTHGKKYKCLLTHLYNNVKYRYMGLKFDE